MKMKNQKPSLGWQSWSPPFPAWHGYPKWDYSPFQTQSIFGSDNVNPKTSTNLRYWCSWYAYGWDITDEKIRKTIKIIKDHSLPFTHILIDDGWTTWGDWHNPDLNRFPDLAETIKHISKNKLKAGLWFAPFLASSKSKVYTQHPDWFVKYNNKPVQGLKTMPIWEKLLPKQYLLNFELPEVKKYITDFIDLAISKWGINLLKLDFLYAPYFNPILKSDIVPHDQIVWLLKYIKSKYSQVQVVACGAPFAPTIGNSDVIRISKDTALPPISPKIINKMVYSKRVRLLSSKMSLLKTYGDFPADPDVRMFSLDNMYTISIWDTIATNILGVGDDLSKLSSLQLNKVKTWLTNHNFQ